MYSLCDMALSTIQGLASAMKLDLAGLGQYAGAIILPRGLYRALDKAERGEGLWWTARGCALSRLAQLVFAERASCPASCLLQPL